ncbi:metallophosphoesterase family protein [Magnetococcales bacterium HHB-1]
MSTHATYPHPAHAITNHPLPFSEKILWLTDVHLDFLSGQQFALFIQVLEHRTPEAILLSGDIGTSENIIYILTNFARHLPCPIFFVLGNHDYYGSSIQTVRKEVDHLQQQFPHLHYLTLSGLHSLTPHLGLIGHDGWSDGRLGNFTDSTVVLNDYIKIEELAQFNLGKKSWIDREELKRRLHFYGDQAASHILKYLPSALERYRNILLLTHVPPFKESCWHQDQIANDNWLPHFTCKAMGDAVLKVMKDYPEHQLTILCGHTHCPGIIRMQNNITVFTGQSDYGKPIIQNDVFN